MAVPDTNTFSLQDVAGELNYDDYPTNSLIDDSHATVDRLSANLAQEKGAFKVAFEKYPNGFNDLYYSGEYKLSDFRDFDKTRIPPSYGITGGSWGYFNPWATSTQGGYGFTAATHSETVTVTLTSTPTEAGTNGILLSVSAISNPVIGTTPMITSISPSSFTGTNSSGSTTFSITITVSSNGNKVDDRSRESRQATLRFAYPGGYTDRPILQLAGDDNTTGGGSTQ
jgi:hypothetical protein